MRVVSALLLFTTVSAFAQLGRSDSYGPTPQLQWTFGVQKVQPTLSASAAGSKDGKASLVDTQADLGLAREGTPLGFFAEYQGQSQAFLISYDSARYAGNRILSRDIALNGTSYLLGTPLQTAAKVELIEAMWTYKFVQRPDAWVGFDLGAQYLRANVSALVPSAPPPQKVSPTGLVPQIGITGWSSGAGGLLESRVYARYFTYKGASLTRYGLDARAYFYPSFGVRAFFEDSRIRVPQGSLQQDLEVQVERKVTGLGLVIRF